MRVKDHNATVVIRRDDYAPPPYWIRHRRPDLRPRSGQDAWSSTGCRSSATPTRPPQPLRLHGEELNLTRVLVDGQRSRSGTRTASWCIDTCPTADAFTLEIRTTCAPEKNTKLSGLYTSSGGFFTQCEARASAASPTSSTGPT